MAEIRLHPKPVLGVNTEIGGIRIRERSDLALHARVTPVGDGVLIEPGLVYVP